MPDAHAQHTLCIINLSLNWLLAIMEISVCSVQSICLNLSYAQYVFMQTKKRFTDKRLIPTGNV